jgi:hypothetical protein
MPDVTGELTKRMLSLGRGRRAYDPRIVLFPLLVSLGLVVAIVLLVAISLPAIAGLGFDNTEYYRESSAAMIVLPRALPIGLIAGVVLFVAAMRLGDQMGRMLSGCVLGLFGVAVIVALTLLFGNGLPSATYLSADAADIFLVALIPIGVPAVVGAVFGGPVAAVS